MSETETSELCILSETTFPTRQRVCCLQKVRIIIPSFTSSPPRLLIMEDEPDVRDLYVMVLEQEGYEIHTTSTIQEARDRLLHESFDLFLSDIMMGDGRGTDLLREIMPILNEKGTRVVLASGAARYQPLSDELGADLFFAKPLDIVAFAQLIRRLLFPSPQAVA